MLLTKPKVATIPLGGILSWHKDCMYLAPKEFPIHTWSLTRQGASGFPDMLCSSLGSAEDLPSSLNLSGSFSLNAQLGEKRPLSNVQVVAHGL